MKFNTSRRWVAGLAFALAAPLLVGVLPTADAAPAPAASLTVAAPPAVSNTLRVLDRLHGYGYTWTSDAGADRAIRHWQKANGLVVDGIVGSQTLHSLGLDAGTAEPTPAPASPPTKVAPSGQGATEPAPQLDLPAPEAGSVESIIRDVWPDDVEDWAVRVATRESNLVPTARNSCCYGLFQINYRAHRAWMAAYGVNSPADLLDARTNATVALALYQQAGKGPWLCHGACRDV